MDKPNKVIFEEKVESLKNRFNALDIEGFYVDGLNELFEKLSIYEEDNYAEKLIIGLDYYTDYLINRTDKKYLDKEDREMIIKHITPILTYLGKKGYAIKGDYVHLIIGVIIDLILLFTGKLVLFYYVPVTTIAVYIFRIIFERYKKRKGKLLENIDNPLRKK